MRSSLLLACDLDGTVLPNGPLPLSPNAIEAFRVYVAKHDMLLAYISGRSLELAEDAIREYGIPEPDIYVGDVGTTIYQRRTSVWEADTDWNEELAKDWSGRDASYILELLRDVPGLTLQEKGGQNEHKVSYYTEFGADAVALKENVGDILDTHNIRASLITSFDEARGAGFLDVLPQSAHKGHALKYIQKKYGYEDNATVYAGDSGNDIEALISGVFGILVANTHASVRAEVKHRAEERNAEDRIYLAKGGYRDMNGNYAAGILEGLDYFSKKGFIEIARRSG